MSKKIEELQSEEVPNPLLQNNLLFLKNHSDALQRLLENNEPSEEWQVLWDNRDKLIEHKEEELKSLAYVDEVTDSIKGKILIYPHLLMRSLF